MINKAVRWSRAGAPVTVVSCTMAQVMWMDLGCMSGEEEIE